MQNLTEKISNSSILSKHRYVWFLVFLFCANISWTQDYVLSKTINVNAEIIQADKLGNFYISHAFSLEKYDKDGKLLHQWETYNYGEISQIDVTDPLKLIVFYEDFMTVVVLDKTLSEISNYQLSNAGFDWVSAIGHSRDDRFWLYDISDFKLKKVNESGEVFNESEVFYEVLDEEVTPNFIVEQESNVFLTNGENGIYVFDEFCTFQKRIPIENVDFFQVIQNQILYFEENHLKSYNFKTFAWEEMVLPAIENIQKAIVSKENLLLSTKEYVYLYKRE